MASAYSVSRISYCAGVNGLRRDGSFLKMRKNMVQMPVAHHVHRAEIKCHIVESIRKGENDAKTVRRCKGQEDEHIVG